MPDPGSPIPDSDSPIPVHQSLMSLSAILFLFLVHLGIGIVLVLVWVGREAGVKFFRFNAGTAVLLIGIGFALRPASANSSPIHTASLAALLIAEAALVVYWATIGRMLARIRPVLLWTAVVGGVVSVTLQALDVSSDAPGLMPLLTVASFLSSVALLGAACGAMVLGHWYLVVPSLDVAHLQSIVRLHIGSTVVRVVVVGAAVMIAIVTWSRACRTLSAIFFRSTAFFSGSAFCSASAARRCCRT